MCRNNRVILFFFFIIKNLVELDFISSPWSGQTSRLNERLLWYNSPSKEVLTSDTKVELVILQMSQPPLTQKINYIKRLKSKDNN
jgi:hypothetical protein